MEAPQEQELRQLVAPHRPQETYIKALVAGWPDLDRAGINTPLRLAHFLAQIAHETGGFTILREYTNWTPQQMCELWPSRFKSRLDPRIALCKGDPEKLANLAYSGRSKDLGNQGGDDGWDYRGGGFMQTTGRANYRAAGAAIGVDLEGQPELIEDGSISLRAAIWEWTRMGCNAFADRNYAHAVGNAINRGDAYAASPPIGAAAREQWLVRAWALFGQGPLPNPDDLALGAQGAKVQALQDRLKELGYAIGSRDGIYGPTLARAVAAFKMDFRREHFVALEPDDLVGEATQRALAEGRPVRVSAARAAATPQQLAAAGSTEIKSGLQQQVAGTAMAFTGAVEAGRQFGALDYLKEISGTVSFAKSAMVPLMDAISWGLKNAFWAAVILGGVWVWTKGRQGVLARLKAHVEGWNLFR